MAQKLLNKLIPLSYTCLGLKVGTSSTLLPQIETSIKPEVTTWEKGGGRKCKQLIFDFEVLYFTDSGVGKEDRVFAQQKNTQITLAGSEDESSD